MAGTWVRGDLGKSVSTGEPVARTIRQRFQLSALVALLAVGLATSIAILAGLIAAWKRDAMITSR
jgi:peptide/nickel transport system permease protein